MWNRHSGPPSAVSPHHPNPRRQAGRRAALPLREGEAPAPSAAAGLLRPGCRAGSRRRPGSPGRLGPLPQGAGAASRRRRCCPWGQRPRGALHSQLPLRHGAGEAGGCGRAGSPASGCLRLRGRPCCAKLGDGAGPRERAGGRRGAERLSGRRGPGRPRGRLVLLELGPRHGAHGLGAGLPEGSGSRDGGSLPEPGRGAVARASPGAAASAVPAWSCSAPAATAARSPPGASQGAALGQRLPGAQRPAREMGTTLRMLSSSQPVSVLTAAAPAPPAARAPAALRSARAARPGASARQAAEPL